MEKAFDITPQVLERINSYALEPLKAQDVFCFTLTLCDNDIDRDFERFSKQALETLGELFLGKTGIFDHDPKGSNQTARIFETSLEAQPGRLTRDGQPYFALKAKAYMVRTSANADLIKEISGGIKKEVSVSCAVKKRSCSICGHDRSNGGCSHAKGRRYGEKLCFDILEEPTDAYEWSFVAVPAQVRAGVTKRFGADEDSSRLAKRLKSELGEAYRRLDAAHGHIRGEILRLSYFCQPYYTAAQVSEMTAGMDIYRLLALRKQLEDQVNSRSSELEAMEKSFITRQPEPGEEDNAEYVM